MFTFDLPVLFRTLEDIPGLQNKEWERNQSGADRGMEAVLIQRAPRELATYALTRLKLVATPDLLSRCQNHWATVGAANGGLEELRHWGQTQGPGGSMLANVMGEERGASDRACAALASLCYYRYREDDNPGVKSEWTSGALGAVRNLDVTPLLEYPTRGSVWQAKLETVQRLVEWVADVHHPGMSELDILRGLQGLQGVGEQTSSMVALFWLRRPVPIIDMYLLRLLEVHGLVNGPIKASSQRRELGTYLVAGARAIAADHKEWPAWRVLSCLYLWACEVGRLRCRCSTGQANDCPLWHRRQAQGG